jgi:hypothetical protein
MEILFSEEGKNGIKWVSPWVCHHMPAAHSCGQYPAMQPFLGSDTRILAKKRKF